MKGPESVPSAIRAVPWSSMGSTGVSQQVADPTGGRREHAICQQELPAGDEQRAERDEAADPEDEEGERG